MFTRLGQAGIDGIATMGDVVYMLPGSPFSNFNAVVLESELLSFIAWLVPLPEMIALAQGWLVAITGWYIAKTALRWAKVIQ